MALRSIQSFAFFAKRKNSECRMSSMFRSGEKTFAKVIFHKWLEFCEWLLICNYLKILFFCITCGHLYSAGNAWRTHLEDVGFARSIPSNETIICVTWHSLNGNIFKRCIAFGSMLEKAKKKLHATSSVFRSYEILRVLSQRATDKMQVASQDFLFEAIFSSWQKSSLVV